MFISWFIQKDKKWRKTRDSRERRDNVSNFASVYTMSVVNYTKWVFSSSPEQAIRKLVSHHHFEEDSNVFTTCLYSGYQNRWFKRKTEHERVSESHKMLYASHATNIFPPIFLCRYFLLARIAYSFLRSNFVIHSRNKRHTFSINFWVNAVRSTVEWTTFLNDSGYHTVFFINVLLKISFRPQASNLIWRKTCEHNARTYFVVGFLVTLQGRIHASFKSPAIFIAGRKSSEVS